MLFDDSSILAPLPDFEVKSATDTPQRRPSFQSARRYRPRKTTSDRVRDAVLALAHGHADLLDHNEKPWSSITFSGTRHELTLDFNGQTEAEAGEVFVAALPEHEFIIPGQLVADATIAEFEHSFASDERVVVKAVLLLLEDR